MYTAVSIQVGIVSVVIFSGLKSQLVQMQHKYVVVLVMILWDDEVLYE